MYIQKPSLKVPYIHSHTLAPTLRPLGPGACLQSDYYILMHGNRGQIISKVIVTARLAPVLHTYFLHGL